jgi:phosphodiesterase/alkaline phosphatase D-like protein
VFRVRVDGLEPHTTYYYKVDSQAADGTSVGVSGPVKTFTHGLATRNALGSSTAQNNGTQFLTKQARLMTD